MSAMIDFIKNSIAGQEDASKLMERLFETASPQKVFGEPQTNGDYTIITANEVSVALGYGFGSGGGSGPEEAASEEDEETAGETAYGFGGGGGGGGAASARPVAVIEIGPNGVRVEPIVDPTKIAIAFFTAFGSMWMMLAKMRRQAGG